MEEVSAMKREKKNPTIKSDKRRYYIHEKKTEILFKI